MRKAILALLTMTSVTAFGQSALIRQEIDLRRRHETAVGMERLWIEDELAKVRAQIQENKKQVAPGKGADPLFYRVPGPKTAPPPPPRAAVPEKSWLQKFFDRLRGFIARPAVKENDWKKDEKPYVVVKGIMKQGDRYVAMVSGGQMVSLGDEFSTQYRGTKMVWRVTSINAEKAQFARIGMSDPAPPPSNPEVK